MAPENAVRPGARLFAQASCSLPGCGKALHIEHDLSRPVYLSDTAQDLADVTEAYTSSWRVVCEGGHVLLLPVDSAVDTYTFGQCTCDDTADPDGFCGHTDLHRLRVVIGTNPVPME